MKEVIDRVPTRPNRIKLTSESDGSINYYAWERADEPTVDGTPINKELFDSIGTDITSLQQTTSKNTSDIRAIKAHDDEQDANIANLNNATRINLSRPTLETTTKNGVICTNNGDGTYTLNGTNSSGSSVWFEVSKNINIVANKTYKIIGCPKHGLGLNKCFIELYKMNEGSIVETRDEIGNGMIYTSHSDLLVGIEICVRAGTTVENLVFKPMLTTNLNATYDDFVSYEDSLATNKVIATRMNLLKPTLQTKTQNGVTCVNNGDGTYTLNGTASADIMIEVGYIYLKNGSKLIGSPIDGSNDTYCLYAIDSLNWISAFIDYGKGTIISGIDEKVLYSVRIDIKNGYTCNNLVFKPMITTNLNATYDDFISCLGTSWPQDTTNGYYTQSIICSGITSNDNPPIDVVLSGTLEEMQAQQEEWGKILKVETSTDTLKFYASEPTTVSLSVMVKGV